MIQQPLPDPTLHLKTSLNLSHLKPGASEDELRQLCAKEVEASKNAQVPGKLWVPFCIHGLLRGAEVLAQARMRFVLSKGLNLDGSALNYGVCIDWET